MKISKRKLKLLFYKLTFNKKKVNEYKEREKKEEIRDKIFDSRLKELKKLKKYRKNKRYLLTIYVVTFNHQKTIERCLQSILSQKTKYPYIIKILEDCSSDNTFNICLKYAQKYPEKIELITARKNTGGKLLTVAYENINTKYFCRLDGDDYWCDDKKVQIALKFLEKHDDFVTYAHDTDVHVLSTNKHYSNVHDFEVNKNVQNEITINDFVYIHVSSRIHRNVLDMKRKHKNTRKRDRVLWYLLLDAGRAYYDDRKMAVYTIGSGQHNRLPAVYKLMSRTRIAYNANKFFNFKYDAGITQNINNHKLVRLKKIFGKRLGWILYVIYIEKIKYIIFLKQVKRDLRNKYKYNLLICGDFNKKERKKIKSLRDELKLQ